MSAVLDTIKVVENDELIKSENSRCIKTKPLTFMNAKKYYHDNLNFDLEEKKDVVSVVQNDEGMNTNVEKLENENVVLLNHDYSVNKHYSNSKPLKIKPGMFENIYGYYDKFSENDTNLNNQNDQEQEIQTQSFESVENNETVLEFEDNNGFVINNEEENNNEIIENELPDINIENNIETSNVTNDEIPNNQDFELPDLNINDNFDEESLQEIVDNEIDVNQEKQLRDDVQVVPDRQSDYQKIIDNEFANQEVTMISNDEVNETVNNDVADVPFKISKFSNKEINIDNENDNVLRMIEKSISDALDKVKDEEKEESNNSDISVDKEKDSRFKMIDNVDSEFNINDENTIPFKFGLINNEKDVDNENTIHFDYSKATTADLNKAVSNISDKGELSEILRVVKEQQNRKEELSREKELALQHRNEAQSERERANKEYLDKELQKQEAIKRVEEYLAKLENENNQESNQIENYKKESEDYSKEAESFLEKAEQEQNEIDEINDVIGKVSLRSA